MAGLNPIVLEFWKRVLLPSDEFVDFLLVELAPEMLLLLREMENINRGPTFGDFVTFRTERSMQYVSVAIPIHYMSTHHAIKPSWRLVQPPSETLLEVNSALLKKLPQLALMPPDEAQPAPCGISGKPSAKNYILAPTCNPLMTPYCCYKSLPRGSPLSHGGRSPTSHWADVCLPWQP